MNKRTFTILTLFIFFQLNTRLSIPLIAQGFPCDGRFYISLSEGQRFSYLETNFFKVDFTGDVVDFTENIVYPDIKVNGIGYNRKDQLIYGINQNSNSDGIYTIIRFYPDGTYEELPMGESTNSISWNFAAADCSPEGYFVVHDPDSQQLHYLDVLGEEVTLFKTVPLAWSPEVGIEDFHVAMDDFAFDVSNSSIIYTYQRNYEKDPKENAQTKGHLLRIDGNLKSPEVGTVSLIGKPNPDVVVHIGALFFTASNELYGYSSQTPNEPNPPGLEHKRLISLDKESGEATLVGEGPIALSNDGCSCPFSLGIHMEAISSSEQCQSTVDYKVTIQNSSFETISGITFTDTLPQGMTIANFTLPDDTPLDVGDDTGLGLNVLTFNNLSLPAQTDISFVISADARGLVGTFQHQAYLVDIPPAFGPFLISDDTTTAQPYDPTEVVIDEVLPTTTLDKDTTVCRGQTLELSAEVDATWSYYWSSKEGFYSEEANPAVNLPDDQNSIYYYLHQQKGLCTLVDSILVTIVEAPDIKLIENTTIVEGASVDLAPDFIPDTDNSYTWSPSQTLSCAECANPSASPNETTEYMLTITNAAGCTQSKNVLIEVEPLTPGMDPNSPREEVQIPNAFSPNGDGLNDTFFPKADEKVIISSLEIYNRWGEIVFAQYDFATNESIRGWDGYYQGKLANGGTYSYRLVAILPKDRYKEYNGIIHLVR